jgi:transposase
MRAYSTDLRQRVLADCDAGMKTGPVADKYTVSTAWVRRLKQRRRQPAPAGPPPRRGRPPALAGQEGRLRRAVADRPDATLAELRDALGLKVSLATLCRALQALRLSVKKKSSRPPSGAGPTSRSGAPAGWSRCSASTPTDWCSSTKLVATRP